jgi:nitronate monooxygenase
VKKTTATLAARIRCDLKLPVIIAPMFLVSGPELVVAGAKAGVAGMDGIVTTKAVTGVLCNWLQESVAAAGLDETRLAAQAKIDFSGIGRPQDSRVNGLD